jgi:hypothetical protein
MVAAITETGENTAMKKGLRMARIFIAWLIVCFLQGVLYTAHRGVDLPEISLLAPIFAAIATFYWLRKFPR